MTHAENDHGGVGEYEAVDILAKISELEAAWHLAGWDQPATLWFLFRDGSWGGVPQPVPEPVPEALELLARMLPLPVEPFLNAVEKTVEKHPVAVVLACETWQNSDFPIPAARELDTRDLADIPSSVEVRVVSAVDLEGHKYWAHRVRGHEPTVRAEGPGEDDWQAGGRVFDALIKIATVLRQARGEVAT